MKPASQTSSPPPRKPAPERVSLAVHRQVVVLDVKDKRGVELRCVDGLVTVQVLPRNGSRREPVRLEDLKRAVEQLG